MNTSPVIFLMGPTASGKTELAMKIADEFACEIISVDSVMVYRGLNIGAAKPDADTLKKYPHHLVDILEPEQSYSAADFRDDAVRLIEVAHSNQKIPLLVGGTMLYFSTLLRGISSLPAADPALRKKITDQAEAKGWEYMHTQLAEVDPRAAQRIHKNDPQRIQRALEVHALSGVPISTWHDESDKNKLPFKVLKMALIPDDRARLHARIEKRFDQMLQAGFLDEVKTLYQKNTLHTDLPAIRSVGYRQVWKHLQGEYDAVTMREKAIIATRQLAKRQLTWLRGESGLCTFSAEIHNFYDVRQQIQSYLA